MYVVYVLNKKGEPLMPTTRFKTVRELLRDGKAVPVCNDPFTIKLKYETPNKIDPLKFKEYEKDYIRCKKSMKAYGIEKAKEARRLKEEELKKKGLKVQYV